MVDIITIARACSENIVWLPIKIRVYTMVDFITIARACSQQNMIWPMENITQPIKIRVYTMVDLITIARACSQQNITALLSLSSSPVVKVINIRIFVHNNVCYIFLSFCHIFRIFSKSVLCTIKKYLYLYFSVISNVF